MLSQIEAGGVNKRNFWRNLASLVDEKAQTGQIKNLDVGDTIDLAYNVEMYWPLMSEGIGTAPIKSSRIPKKLKYGSSQ